jgi:EmrB/QacA subfamily drug resistance transporter
MQAAPGPLLSTSSDRGTLSSPAISQSPPAVLPDIKPARDRRNITLAVVQCAQLMIVLDMTVVNVALPSMATGLHLSATGLSWVLNAYTLTFGGLLLLGGRAGDVLGRRTTFMAGLALFTLASLAGGLATSSGMLLAARAVQGVGGAIAAPAVLATIVSSFPEGRERVRALGAFTAVAMGGASLGLVLGGIITQWASWRWVFFVNVPVGIAVIAVAPRLLARGQRLAVKLDLGGAFTSTGGMSALVYGFIHAASAGWANATTIASFAAAAVLLGLFLFIESRAQEPITPLWLLRDRSRAASYVTRLLLVGGMFGMFFFLTQFVQEVLGFSPLKAGLSFVPMTATLLLMSRLAPRLVPRFGAKPLAGPGEHQHHLLARHPRPDAAARRGHGPRVRAADDGLARRRAAAGLWRGRVHGQRHAAGRRRARPGDPRHDLRERPAVSRRARGARTDSA